MMHERLAQHEIVLLGVGHTNAHIARMWRMDPIPHCRLTCVSNASLATYSGMLPAVLAGQLAPERMHIDLVRLCAAGGIRLIVDQVTEIDVLERHLKFRTRPSVPFDLLSVGIGSVPAPVSAEAGLDSLVAIKPMQTFRERLQRRLTQLRTRGSSSVRVIVVGGGIGGVETTLCVSHYVTQCMGPKVEVKLSLVDAHRSIPHGCGPSLARRVRNRLERAQVQMVLGSQVQRVTGDAVLLDSGARLPADLVLLASGAVGPPLLQTTNCGLDDRGFLLTEPTLQVVDQPHVFAVGDSGTMLHAPTPKAGVYAVRQGPVLWNNLRASVERRPLAKYSPQQGFLKLINSGDGSAMGEYLGFSFQGRWAKALKDTIDGAFMDKYQDYALMQMQANVDEGPVMRCAGCGGKVGASVLESVMRRLDLGTKSDAICGLDTPDDVALIANPSATTAVTTDFFRLPLDDPYLSGRIAALNALSDVYASRAEPFAALANVILPDGAVPQQEELLYQILAGSLYEFQRAGVELVGGHTIEGAQTVAGFTVLATPREAVWLKSGMRVGDDIVLTKPLGSGALLAAQMQAACSASWFESLLDTLLLSNRKAAELAEAYDVSAMTDVTGFGFAGHLIEMLRASKRTATIHLCRIPLLPGLAETLSRDIESTLAPANRKALRQMVAESSVSQLDAFDVLFDPQTSGGLLVVVGKADSEAYLKQLVSCGHQAAIVGRVGDRQGFPEDCWARIEA